MGPLTSLSKMIFTLGIDLNFFFYIIILKYFLKNGSLASLLKCIFL